MKFVVSSTELLSHLSAISKVINSKNTLPILDNYLFLLEDKLLTVTASDLESTLITSLELENTSGTGVIAVPAKLMNETLKEFPEQPLTFQIDPDTFGIEIFSQNGKFSIAGQNGEDYPQVPMINEASASTINVNHNVLLSGINKIYFATADD